MGRRGWEWKENVEARKRNWEKGWEKGRELDKKRGWAFLNVPVCLGKNRAKIGSN